MSRAFVTEDAGANAPEQLPERPISGERNLVTRRGLLLIDRELERLHAAYSAEQGRDDKTVLAQVMRDLKYWISRSATAELVEPAADAREVRFGHCVTLETDNDTKQFCITGLDEADPAKGYLSYISPIARLMLGRAVGDIIALPQGEAEIVKISLPDQTAI